jgi:hypothetical protein
LDSFIYPSNSAWLGIAFGLLVALLFNIISIRFLIGKLTLGYLLEAISCVKPILSRLLILSGSVLFVGQIFNKTALNAIVIVIPILVIFQMMRRPETTQFIIQNLTSLIKNSGDEMLLISVSMFLGSILSGSTEIQNFISLKYRREFSFLDYDYFTPIYSMVFCFIRSSSYNYFSSNIIIVWAFIICLGSCFLNAGSFNWGGVLARLVALPLFQY